jgi:uncharacterized protein YcaQ
VQLSAYQARRFLVRRHLLDPPRLLAPTATSVLKVIERLGSLQFDPLEVPGARNHDLVLHARIAGYQRSWCDRYLYAPKGKRRLFEAYNKSLNLLPVAELPYYRLAWHRARGRYDDTLFTEHARGVRAILRRLREDGALSTAAFKESHRGEIDWHWAKTTEGRALLEALFEAGHVGIARRDGNRRTYDLIERLFPEALLEKRVSHDASQRHRLLSRYRGHGLLGQSAGTEVHTGTGTAAERARIVEALVDEGVLLAVEVEGVRGPRYVLGEERAILRSAQTTMREENAEGVTFVAPLDPLLWDRRLLRTLFDFDYIWEVYTPAAKRRHGYYALPILFGDRLVGRIEPRLDRARGTLHLAGLWFERGFDPVETPGFAVAFGDALAAYRVFVGATNVTWLRGRIARALQRGSSAAAESGGVQRLAHAP